MQISYNCPWKQKLCIFFYFSVRLDNTTFTLQALYGNEWLSVCYSTWNPQWSEDVCRSTGQGAAISTSPITATTSTNASQQFLSASGDSPRYHSGLLINISACVDNQVVKIRCQEKLCGHRALDSAPAAHIIGGDIAAPGAWPWVGALYYTGQLQCVVTLIDKDFAIAPTHCFFISSNGYNTANLPHYYTVQLGSNRLLGDKSLQRQLLRVEKIYTHPNYTLTTSGRRNDIAVIKLASSAIISDYVNTMCVPNEKEGSVYTTDVCYVAGWGFTYRDRRKLKLTRQKFKKLSNK